MRRAILSALLRGPTGIYHFGASPQGVRVPRQPCVRAKCCVRRRCARGFRTFFSTRHAARTGTARGRVVRRAAVFNDKIKFQTSSPGGWPMLLLVCGIGSGWRGELAPTCEGRGGG
eukprot:364400-Chlamydomonas_euryale.AAC.2